MISEAEFHDLVAAWLAESFENVEHEPTLPSGEVPDFIAETPFGSYVIEVEDTFEEIRGGIGQVVDYAAQTGHEPIVVVPADTVEEPKFSKLEQSEMWPRIETV